MTHHPDLGQQKFAMMLSQQGSNEDLGPVPMLCSSELALDVKRACHDVMPGQQCQVMPVRPQPAVSAASTLHTLHLA